MIASAAAFPGRPRPRPHGGPAPSRRYERRRPEKTPLHKIVSENLESWLAWREAAERPVPGYVEEELRGYLECGILCFGFARALCTGCGQAFVFMPPTDDAGCDAPPAFLPARPINHADLAALTEAPPSLPRRLCGQPQAQAGRHGAGNRECRQAARGRDLSPSPSGRGPG